MDGNEDSNIDAQIEKALHLGDLRKEIMDRVGEGCVDVGTENVSMDMQAKFLERILAFESADDSTFFERLSHEAKLLPVPPEEFENDGQA